MKKKKKIIPHHLKSNRALEFIEALGGKENIISTSACITRLRMEVNHLKI